MIEIDKGSGFCFGVTTAIRKAEEELEKTGHLYCLGDIVHNTAEVDRLASRGLETITHEQLEELHDVKVLLRAHGEPPETYETARRNRIEIIDATCPVVLKLQQRIHATYHGMEVDKPAPQIVIYGKRGHAEVLGLVGQTQGRATVIENIGEIDKIDYSRDIYLYSQTTKSVQEFQHIVEEIKSRVQPGVTFRSFDTICRSVANRIPQIREFARQHELILFVSGAKSSNGRILFAECQDANPDSHLISGEGDIDPAWLQGKERIGICGATSTPRWLMQQVSESVQRLIQETNS
jgi:4-hydroxy-3-methylbut-2-enyl diphosphate reductase